MEKTSSWLRLSITLHPYGDFPRRGISSANFEYALMTEKGNQKKPMPEYEGNWHERRGALTTEFINQRDR